MTQPPAPLTLDQLQAMWPAVVEVIRGANAMLAALLADARPVSVTDGELTLALPAGAAFQRKKAEQDEHRRAAAEAVRNVTGATLMLRYELADATAHPLPEAAPAPVLTDEQIVQRFVEELNAQEIEEETE